MRIVDDRYVLEDRLGGGGMGTVYRARDQLMEKHQDRDPFVALKLINESLRGSPEARTMLQRECSRVQRLAHPNIIRIFYFGCDKANDTDYLTMELLRGETLDCLIQRHPGGLDWQRSAPIIEQLCSGLDFAHGQGVVHSDIKPSNLFLTESNVLKILDFGIAAPLRGKGAQDETRFNPRHLGAYTERYSSYEMHRGFDADPSDDVYSASCVIYELLSGRHPLAKTKGVPVPSGSTVPVADIDSLTPEQNAALARGLSFHRALRTATVAELRDGLFPPERPKGRRRIGVAAAVAATALAAGLLWAVWPGDHARPPPPAAVAAVPPTAAVGEVPSPGTAVVGSAPNTSPPADEVRVPSLATSVDSDASSRPSPDPVPARPRPPMPARARSAPHENPATIRHADAKKPPDTRCDSITERSQLGESLNDEERDFMQRNCH